MFELTKRKLGANTFPIVRTSDMSDLSVVDQYADKSTHVWLADDKNKILDTFNWNFRPSKEQFHNIHSFPQCNKKNNRPINWTSVLLVPTDANRRGEMIKQNIVSSYGRISIYPIYFYSIGPISHEIKFNRYNKQYANANLIKNKNNLDEVIREINETESHYFLIDLALNLEEYILSDISSVLDNLETYELMVFPSERRSTSHKMYNFSALLVPKNIKSINDVLKHKIIYYENKSIGEINDMTSPEKAWISAYQTTYILHENIFIRNNKFKNRILTDFISKSQTEISRLYDYIYDGSVAATLSLEDNNNIGLNSCLDSAHMLNQFINRQDSRLVLSNNQKRIRQKVVERTYGLVGLNYSKKILN
tara:strand:- start:219 stop:1310 length:1092 start_codon:yes stop_codon:yes gene_type:complete